MVVLILAGLNDCSLPYLAREFKSYFKPKNLGFSNLGYQEDFGSPHYTGKSRSSHFFLPLHLEQAIIIITFKKYDKQEEE